MVDKDFVSLRRKRLGIDRNAPAHYFFVIETRFDDEIGIVACLRASGMRGHGAHSHDGDRAARVGMPGNGLLGGSRAFAIVPQRDVEQLGGCRDQKDCTNRNER